MLRVLVTGATFTCLIVACGGGTVADRPNTGAQTGALGTFRDGCDEAVCGAEPTPKHQCVGGYPKSVCTKARGACGWQVDCVKDPPAGYDGNIGVGPCGDPTTGEQCGPLPAYDDKDCVHGFISKPRTLRQRGVCMVPSLWTRTVRQDRHVQHARSLEAGGAVRCADHVPRRLQLRVNLREHR